MIGKSYPIRTEIARNIGVANCRVTAPVEVRKATGTGLAPPRLSARPLPFPLPFGDSDAAQAKARAWFPCPAARASPCGPWGQRRRGYRRWDSPWTTQRVAHRLPTALPPLAAPASRGGANCQQQLPIKEL